MELRLVLVATGLMGLSGVPGLVFGWRARFGQWIAAVLTTAASLAGLAGIGLVLFRGGTDCLRLPWPLPGADLAFEIDPLTAFFQAPVLLIAGLGSVYSLGYWSQEEHPRTGRQARFLYGLLAAGMLVLLMAKNAFPFLFGWEAMALGSFFLISTEEHDAEVRQAAWLYLMLTHVGTLALFAIFAILRFVTGSFDFRPLASGEIGFGLLTGLFFLILFAFGLKAGLAPLHLWLPSAHASAPSHVSALMSGVVIKMGIYGLVRFLGFLPVPPVSWGAVLLFLGVASGVGGVLFAIGQHDLKRLLAYHSVENIGIIVMGLGLAMLGRSLNRPDLVVLGLAGGLLHVWNHGLFKALLFLGAGSVIHATGTREIDRMGGLAGPMPRTSLLFLVGAVAICGLPPLNGFVSEFLIYLGLLKSLHGRAWMAAAAPGLAFIGALAVACFVKVYGTVFLGVARTPRARGAHESPGSMTVPMGVLALACFAIGLAPRFVAPVLDRAIAAWTPSTARPRLEDLVPFPWITIVAGGLMAAVLLVRALVRTARVPKVLTWDCGYAASSPRVQYTSSSFAESLVSLFRWVLRPRRHAPHVEGLFPGRTRFESRVDDVVLDGMLTPAAKRAEKSLGRFRILQQGSSQRYVLYVLLTMVGLLLWTLPLRQFVIGLFSR